MLGNVAENTIRFEKCSNQTSELRTRFDDDFGRSRNDQFVMEKKTGSWRNVTTNRASTDIRKLINTLASAHAKIWIPLTAEDEKKRKQLSATERFTYGVIALRDSVYLTIPEARVLQESLAWQTVVRGWAVLLCYLYKEDGKVMPHIPSWDILNTRWISGSKGLIWAGYKRYVSAEEIKQKYNKVVEPDSLGRVEVYDFWDSDEFGVEHGGEWLEKPQAHDCSHLPVLILPVGSTPLVQSDRFTDTYKDIGESALVNNRYLYDIESEILTYYLTMVERAAKTPLVHEWDSTKGGAKPPTLDKSPFEAGAEIPIDVGIGEKILDLTPPQMTRDTLILLEKIQGMEGRGGQTPVAYGEINQVIPAAGINILKHASMDNIKPFQKAMERAYEWLAHECVSQYKNGGFKKMEIQGLDGSNRYFRMDVDPKKIDDSWNFKCELQADFPQDMAAKVGMAVQLSQSKLLSDETIRDKFGLVDDTDLEQEKLDREEAYETFFIKGRHLAAVLKDKGDEDGARFILQDIERMKTEMLAPKGVANQPGVPSAVRPSADTTAVIPVPPEIRGQRKFLSRIGGQ